MPDRHKHHPVTLRLPEGDRAWVLAYAEQTGLAGETPTATVRRHLALALAEYRAAHSGVTTRPVETPQPAPVETPRRNPRPAAHAREQERTSDRCPHPKSRRSKGLCMACGTYAGAL